MIANQGILRINEVIMSIWRDVERHTLFGARQMLEMPSGLYDVILHARKGWPAQSIVDQAFAIPVLKGEFQVHDLGEYAEERRFVGAFFLKNETVNRYCVRSRDNKDGGIIFFDLKREGKDVLSTSITLEKSIGLVDLERSHTGIREHIGEAKKYFESIVMSPE
ncbi:hypothetical protein J4208_02595 [Candidatus Woesearchaeota archaeon]|nr:hypothetical protein [Candidatus Woesearchaeota archaeon]